MSDSFDITWTQAQQEKASNPARSAWVSANAGSGKTHVLAQRVVRLLLNGCRPSAILCLTYTKAAASEMSNRVFERLAEWTRLDDAALSARLADIEGRRPDALRLAFARQLFARALETPGGLKIQTIHAFCEAVLHQFPLEANVAGHFEVLDEAGARRLLDEAREALLTEVAQEADARLVEAFRNVLAATGQWGMDRLFEEIVGERAAINEFGLAAERQGGEEKLLRRITGLDPDDTEDSILSSVWPLAGFQGPALAEFADVARSQKAKRAREFVDGLMRAEALDEPQDRYTELATLFLTSEGKPRKLASLATKSIQEAIPDLEDRIAEAQDHFIAARDRLQRLRMVFLTCDALVLARRLDSGYEALKRRDGKLDFDDLVARTGALLARDGAGPWVHYKLDRGIDHILVDEAQDTSPEQWAVISRLAAEFFAGQSSRETLRTLFAVGDEKQSIYSFQGARPDLFRIKQREFSLMARDADRHFEQPRLRLSFRSTASVLSAVDDVFEPEEIRRGLGEPGEPVAHSSHRGGEPGVVDLWDMIGKQASDDHDDWRAPFDAIAETAPPAELARRIAGTIVEWLRHEECIVRSGVKRPITAGDILVLVRKRDAFVNALMRELKKAQIPVAGADRLILTGHIAVQDLMALGRVMLMPGDDLSLAAILKSPLFGFDEDMLFRLAAERPERASLFDHLATLAESEGGAWLESYSRLSGLLAIADAASPFEFYARLLGPDGGRQRFLARLGTEAGDILDEFLSFCLDHESGDLPGLQALIASLESASPVIKRELEQGRDEIRIMTGHASKGLEAPVVFLVDSGGKPADERHAPRLQTLPIEAATGLPVSAPLWIPGKSYANSVGDAMKSDWLSAMDDEYRRLLYVGMTRAADRLIVCGYHGIKVPSWRHWHATVKEAFSDNASVTPMTFSAGGAQWEGLRYTQHDAEGFHRQSGPAAPESDHPPLPGALGRPLPKPARLPRPLTPSSTGLAVEAEPSDAPVMTSPFDNERGDERPLERGRVVHRLLQLLPDQAPAERRRLAARYLGRALPDWSPPDCEALADSILEILEDPRFAPVFSPASRAEVSMMGTLEIAGEQRAVSARLDRLAVSEGEVLIVDYKTDRNPPADESGVAQVYLTQLALYRALLQPIYPDRTVRAALLYTEAPRLIVCDNRRLDETLLALSTM
ncbi:double-strand break repair helicase AddA [Hoeflea sp. WL0058]|uniref:DNA 3'-5' helicase n=1 Tax=Flavimaribacter sediminis TaxID=2865987 RepID=A0AAE2ZL63_9HYPH|nr:double-strand break repair helicase AddA [Flavimaribacter sediminis]MBW8638231.1 double-strand break repair helicase AddA [Flavimaribacter sediminis]